jgi:hypothetical protein
MHEFSMPEELAVIRRYLGVKEDAPLSELFIVIKALRKNSTVGCNVRESAKAALTKMLSVTPYGNAYDPPCAWQARLQLKSLNMTLFSYDVHERTKESSHAAKQCCEHCAKMFVDQFVECLGENV